MKVEKILKGFSGSQIFICSDGKKKFVRKQNNIHRNIKRINSLKNLINLPKIYKITKDYYDMQYINGVSIEQYLIENNVENLLNFILKTLEKLSKDKFFLKNYSETYLNFLDGINDDEMVFSKKNLFKKLPKELPKTQYHGDFTLENMIFKKKFFVIDCSEGIFDSYIFDYSKLRQDIDVLWFLRKSQNTNNIIFLKLNFMKKKLSKQLKYYNNKYLLILMLLRVYKYTKEKSFEKYFLLEKMNQIWKS